MEPKHTFEYAALEYERHRPGHPEAVFDDIAATTGVLPPARVLEIGCGPGQATLPLARRGYQIHAIELGETLAARARARTAEFPNVRVDVGAFEDFPVAPACAELILCASSFHWLDRERAYPKLHRALVPGGHLALFWSSDVWGEDPTGVRAAMGPIVRAWAPELLEQNRSRVKAVVETIPRELDVGGFFDIVLKKDLPWTSRHDTEGYLGYLGTVSAFIALPEEKRSGLFAELRELIDSRFGGEVTLGNVTKLLIARQRQSEPELHDDVVEGLDDDDAGRAPVAEPQPHVAGLSEEDVPGEHHAPRRRVREHARPHEGRGGALHRHGLAVGGHHRQRRLQEPRSKRVHADEVDLGEEAGGRLAQARHAQVVELEERREVDVEVVAHRHRRPDGGGHREDARLEEERYRGPERTDLHGGTQLGPVEEAVLRSEVEERQEIPGEVRRHLQPGEQTVRVLRPEETELALVRVEHVRAHVEQSRAAGLGQHGSGT